MRIIFVLGMGLIVMAPFFYHWGVALRRLRSELPSSCAIRVRPYAPGPQVRPGSDRIGSPFTIWFRLGWGINLDFALYLTVIVIWLEFFRHW